MASIGRSSALIAAGTLASRLTGLLRTIVLVTLIGSVGSRVGDAFGTANQLPNNIYTVISTGILTAVIVPQIVRVSQRDADGGRSFISKLFTLATVVLLVATAIAMVAAPLLSWLYAPQFTPDQLALTTAFAYWCLPQILFYGLYALVGETLNARGIFGPFAWAPVVNNVVSIAGFGAMIALFGSDLTQIEVWTPGMIAGLGGTATAGIAVQALVLFVFWRRTGLHLRPDFRWRGVGLRNIGKLAGWTFLMMAVTQLAGLLQAQVLSDASGEGPAVFAMQNAWLIFMVPYSTIVLAIGTPYFTQLSGHAAAGRDDEVRSDIGTAIRTLGVFLVFGTAALAAAATPVSRIFTNSGEEAHQAAIVLIAFLVCLVPLSILFVVQRTFYAYNDTRTPFVFTTVQAVLVVVTAYIAAAVLPLEFLAAGIALGQAIASTIQAVIASLLLRRRIGSFGMAKALGSLARFAVAAVPAGLIAWGCYLLMGGENSWMLENKLLGTIGTCVIGLIALVVYVALLALLRAPELKVGTDMVRRFVKR
ncbi:murein biosynthesis integral membrane protein MurJ [Microbacterium halophytorum]|uniref:murein biosynthesis integral membrane protein MurJ n=1 Tax=Microbacterium halophytorum TaxID=2067568 RepID=UPI000CFD8938|nr:murein biosynthesis integral membrane protein MurJ [Microbacterium halophytorum]